MKVTAEKIENSQVVLNIELDEEQVAKGLDLAYRRVVNRVVIPGFRKGRAPRWMVERHVGRSALLEEAVERILPDVYQQALSEQEIDAIAEPKVEVVELEPVTVKAIVPVRPTVDLGDYRSVRVETTPVEISEERIQQVLEQIRAEQTPWEPVERPIQAGDRVTLDVVQKEGDGEPVERTGLDYIVREGSRFPVPGFAEQLLGLQRGETKIFTLTAPAGPVDLPDADEAPEEAPAAEATEPATEAGGTPVEFQVTVKEIKAQQLPEMDDEWAKGVGEGFDSLAALRERVERNLRRQAEAAERNRVEDETVRKVVEGATVEFPPVLVDREVESMVRDQENDLRLRRLSLDDFLRLTRRSREAYLEELRPAATEKVKTGLVLGEVARAEELKVEPDEIDTEIQRMARAGATGESWDQIFGSAVGRESVSNILLTRKTIRRLVEIATEGKFVYPVEEEEAETATDTEEVEALLEPAATEETAEATEGVETNK